MPAEPTTVAESVTVADLVTGRVTDWARGRVADPVTRIEQTKEQTNNKPINRSGKPDDAYTQAAEIETVERETSEAESDEGGGQSPDRVGQQAGKTEAERPVRAGKQATLSAAAHEVIYYLNAKTGRDYRPVASNVRLVQARLREGATVEQVKAVIDAKVRQWDHDPTMAEYLRPATLFGATKFEQYLGQLSLNGQGASPLVHDARCVN